MKKPDLREALSLIGTGIKGGLMSDPTRERLREASTLVQAEIARQETAKNKLISLKGAASLQAIKQTDWTMDKGYWEGKEKGLAEAIRTLFPDLKTTPDDQFAVWL